MKPKIDTGKERPAKKSKKDKYAAEKEKREKKRAMKLAKAARGIDDGPKSNLEPMNGDVVMADDDARVEKIEKKKKSKKHKRAEEEDGEERKSKKRKRDLAVDAGEVVDGEMTQSAPSQGDLTLESTDKAEQKKLKKAEKAKKKDPDIMEVDAGVIEKKHKKSKKSKTSAIPELA
jgi:hypothetical protein